eukprot:scaffold33950_cov78-Phaeocystis_antarctica.AAC.8
MTKRTLPPLRDPSSTSSSITKALPCEVARAQGFRNRPAAMVRKNRPSRSSSRSPEPPSRWSLLVRTITWSPCTATSRRGSKSSSSGATPAASTVAMTCRLVSRRTSARPPPSVSPIA